MSSASVETDAATPNRSVSEQPEPLLRENEAAAVAVAGDEATGAASPGNAEADESLPPGCFLFKVLFKDKINDAQRDRLFSTLPDTDAFWSLTSDALRRHFEDDIDVEAILLQRDRLLAEGWRGLPAFATAVQSVFLSESRLSNEQEDRIRPHCTDLLVQQLLAVRPDGGDQNSLATHLRFMSRFCVASEIKLLNAAVRDRLLDDVVPLIASDAALTWFFSLTCNLTRRRRRAKPLYGTFRFRDTMVRLSRLVRGPESARVLMMTLHHVLSRVPPRRRSARKSIRAQRQDVEAQRQRAQDDAGGAARATASDDEAGRNSNSGNSNTQNLNQQPNNQRAAQDAEDHGQREQEERRLLREQLHDIDDDIPEASDDESSDPDECLAGSDEMRFALLSEDGDAGVGEDDLTSSALRPSPALVANRDLTLFNTRDVMDMIVRLALEHIATGEGVRWVCNCWSRISLNDRACAMLMNDGELHRALMRLASFVDDWEAAEAMLKAMNNLTATVERNRACFANHASREFLISIARHCTEPPAAECWCGVVANTSLVSQETKEFFGLHAEFGYAMMHHVLPNCRDDSSLEHATLCVNNLMYNAEECRRTLGNQRLHDVLCELILADSSGGLGGADGEAENSNQNNNNNPNNKSNNKTRPHNHASAMTAPASVQQFSNLGFQIFSCEDEEVLERFSSARFGACLERASSIAVAQAKRDGAARRVLYLSWMMVQYAPRSGWCGLFGSPERLDEILENLEIFATFLDADDMRYCREVRAHLEQTRRMILNK